MTMVVSHHQRIHYRFEGEKGAYLLLHHGLFGSHRDWYEAGYVDALRDEFRLIVLDARGHGRSDHPLVPEEYGLEACADDVIAIMDELDIRNLHFLGYSLGALVGFELLMRHPERVRIVMLAGESPFVSGELLAEWSALAEALPREGLRPLQERLLAEQRLTAAALEPQEEGEQQAAAALLQGLGLEVPRPDEGRISVNSPVALFVGEDDPALNRMRDARRRIHRARFVSFPGQSHAGLFRQRDALIAEMLRLLRPGRRGEEGQPESGDRGDERGQRSGRGRGRGSRGRSESPPVSAPLTPPPPVEVPARADAAAPVGPVGSPPDRSPPDLSPLAEPARPEGQSSGHGEHGWDSTPPAEAAPVEPAPMESAPVDAGAPAGLAGEREATALEAPPKPDRKPEATTEGERDEPQAAAHPAQSGEGGHREGEPEVGAAAIVRPVDHGPDDPSLEDSAARPEEAPEKPRDE